MNKLYLNEFVISYRKIENILNILCMNNKCLKKEVIGKTAFGYNITEYEIGDGKNHILLIGATHGLEIITSYFILEFLITILNYKKIHNKYTFHFIPVLNPEGYIISSCNVLQNIKSLSNYEFEMLSKKYMDTYNYCDNLAEIGKKITNGFYNILKSSVNNIDNVYLKNNVCRILKLCNLSENILPIWASNGLGIDQNSNSIHKFENIKELRNNQKCAVKRYNIIPVTKPSPMSYPGEFTFDRSIENLSLYRFINKIESNQSLDYIFSFHSSGGEIYGYPEKKYDENKELYNKKIVKYKEKMQIYSDITGYKIIDEKLKYGVMDYYRMYLDNTICLTIELSKLNGNPIGPYSNLEYFKEDIIKNKKAVIKAIENL